jgi:hypothetical protein
VAHGELQLSVLCALRPYLNAENAGELFAACSRKSYEQVELLLAARFPKPDVRDLIRRLPLAKVGTPPIGSKESETRPNQLEPGAPLVDAKTEPPASPPVPQTQVEIGQRPAQLGAIKPLSVDRFSVNFTADSEFRELLEEVRALLSHAQPRGDLLMVMKHGLEALRRELLKKRFGLGSKPRRVRLSASDPRSASERSEGFGSKRTRHVPAAVAREVYVRDEGRCTFCTDDGRRCGERRLLQLDHVIPHAEGGEPTVANLRLRCRAHNLHTARVHFGRHYVRAAAERARERARRTGVAAERFHSPSQGET